MQTKTVPLAVPITAGNLTIDSLTLRRPGAGELRGIKLSGISDMDVNTVLALVPRISMTPMAPQAINEIDPADLVSLCEAISGFFTAPTPAKAAPTNIPAVPPSPTTQPPPGES